MTLLDKETSENKSLFDVKLLREFADDIIELNNVKNLNITYNDEEGNFTNI